MLIHTGELYKVTKELVVYGRAPYTNFISQIFWEHLAAKDIVMVVREGSLDDSELLCARVLLTRHGLRWAYERSISSSCVCLTHTYDP